MNYMSDEPTNKTDTTGTKTDTPVEVPKPKSAIEQAREERLLLEETLKKKEELLDREEKLLAEKALGGDTDAGQLPKKPEPLSNKEYAKKVERGEVNPLVDDGFG